MFILINMEFKNVLKSVMFLLIFTLININLVLGQLEIEKEIISNTAIIELDTPALFNITITNTGSTDTFQIYNLVGINMDPSTPFTISKNQSKNILLKVYPRQTIGFYNFEYKIKDSGLNIKTDEINLNTINLKDAFEISVSGITPDSKKAIISFENKVGHSFENVDISYSSAFFEHQDKFSINANEKKQFEIDINPEKSKLLLAGPYIVKSEILINQKSFIIESIMYFNERLGIDTERTDKGILLKTLTIKKQNNGNLKSEATLEITKDIFSAMFTTFSLPPLSKDFQGLNIQYSFQKELSPGQNLEVTAKTNYWISLLIFLLILIAVSLYKKYKTESVVISKRATSVKTKGGEFALKITIRVKAREFVEHLSVIDKIPRMVKIYERFGSITPDKVDHQNRRIEWNIESLNPNEERIFSYIIYSKFGVLGKFELPRTKVTYEHQEKIKESLSEKAFFINEPKEPEKPKFDKNDLKEL